MEPYLNCKGAAELTQMCPADPTERQANARSTVIIDAGTNKSIEKTGSIGETTGASAAI